MNQEETWTDKLWMALYGAGLLVPFIWGWKRGQGEFGFLCGTFAVYGLVAVRALIMFAMSYLPDSTKKPNE